GRKMAKAAADEAQVYLRLAPLRRGFLQGPVAAADAGEGRQPAERAEDPRQRRKPVRKQTAQSK
ncbi:hypothetical protein AZ044_000207, partial [Pluralibacter gergoviae]